MLLIGGHELPTAKCVEWHVPACSTDNIAELRARETNTSSSTLNRCLWPRHIVAHFYSYVSIIASQHTHMPNYPPSPLHTKADGCSTSTATLTFPEGLKVAHVLLIGHVTSRCHLKPSSNARHVPERNSVPFWCSSVLSEIHARVIKICRSPIPVMLALAPASKHPFE